MMSRRRRRRDEYWRLFVAVPISDEIRTLIADIQTGLAGQAMPFRWVDPRLSHLTLKFLGDTSPRRVRDLAAKLQWAAARTGHLKLTTGIVGAFPNTRRPRVAWLGLEGDALGIERLAEDVDDIAVELGYSPENRRFRPHITVGRLRHRQEPPDDFERAVQMLEIPRQTLHIDRIQLYRSVLLPGGPEYSIVDEWELGLEARTPRALNHG